jgi:HK97 gp10 family phage protein
MSSRVEVRSNAYAAIAARTRKAVGAVVAKTVRDIEAGAVRDAPVDTGALQGSIEGDVSKAQSDLYGEVSVGMDYGPHVEMGSVHQKAQPFLTPASEAQREPFARGVASAIERAAEEAAAAAGR